jgi:hypothetical protein
MDIDPDAAHQRDVITSGNPPSPFDHEHVLPGLLPSVGDGPREGSDTVHSERRSE